MHRVVFLVFCALTLALQSYAANEHGTSKGSSRTFENQSAPVQKDQPYWRSKFEAQRTEVVNAKSRLKDAKATLSTTSYHYGRRSRARTPRQQVNRPSPSAGSVQLAQQAVNAARTNLDSTKKSYLRLFDQARQEGALPGWYREYESELEELFEVEEGEDINAQIDAAEEEEEASEGDEPPQKSTRPSSSYGSSSSNSRSSAGSEDDDEEDEDE